MVLMMVSILSPVILDNSFRVRSITIFCSIPVSYTHLDVYKRQPLLSIVFSTIYVYNSSQFIELLSSQPIPRNRIWSGIFLGLSFSQISAFLVGCGLPILLYSSIETGFSLIIAGILLTLVFVSFAILAAISSTDRANGLGIAMFVWIFFNIIYDGILMILMFQFEDFNIEKIMEVLSALNPVGLSRIFVQLQLDVSAMLGYSCLLYTSRCV